MKEIIRMLVGVLLIWTAVALFSGCKQVQTVVEYKERIVHDTLRDTRIEWRDRIRDVYTKGDTVFIHDSVAYVLYDSIEKKVEVQVHDSIPYEVPIEKPVRVRSGYDRFCSWAFWIIVVIVLLRIAWWAFKKFYLHK